MKLKLCVCLAVVGVAVAVTQAVAAPNFTPFLSVDVDGQGGPTAGGWTSFPIASGGLTPWALTGGTTGVNLLNIPTSEGSISVNMKGIAPNSGRDARNRGANSGALTDVTQDFAYANRGVDGFGRHYIRLEISGLTANAIYEFTGFNRDHFNGVATDDPDPNGGGMSFTSWQAWSDLDAIGYDGPDAYMDAEVGVGALYQPSYGTDPNAAGYGDYKNPIPTKTRVQLSGPDDAGDPYAYAGSFYTRADGSGVVRVYAWSDPQGYSGTQTVSLINGFELGVIPEPGTMVLACLGLAGIAGVRRRS